ncbi:MAG: endonuclease/exonuclease/phosphatase family protein [Gemmatimonadota bacterium]|nr:endonuclease/exonuclease/phosphatase family protein [Gemmatimonadota bacterium]
MGPRRVALVALTAGCAVDPSVHERTVWTDGDFDDWEGVTAAVVDPAGDVPAGSPVDLGAVAMKDDARFLHLLIDLGHTVTVQGMRGSVEMVLDTDGDARTGGAYGGMDGADLAVVLTRQPEPERDSHGAGVGIRRIGPDGAGEMEQASRVGLLVSPTYSSDRFEVRLDRAAVAVVTGQRGATGQRAAARPGDAMVGRLRYLRAGAVVDETAVFRHTLATPPGEDPPRLGADAVARRPGAHRVVAWNVSSMSFRNNQDAFRRVVAALAPDVLLLDEIHFTVTPDDLAHFTRDLAAAGEGWTWWLASGGGRQRTAVGASGGEVRGERGMGRIGYPPGALEGWLAEVEDEPEVPGRAPPSVLARVEAEGGLSATGAWVTVGGRDVLFVPVDLQSAGYDGSPRDRLRELQARTLNQAIAAALADRPGAGLVVAGDLNVVGSARPLDELRRGLGVGGRDLEVARPERLRDRSLATWRSTWGEDPFSPGRLDYLLYRGTVLRVERAFLFDAADLSARARETLGVLASDTEKSDHLPLVVDFGGRLERPAMSANIPGAV